MIRASLPDHSSILMVGSPGIGLLEFNISLLKDYLTEDVSVIFVTVDVLPSDIVTMMGQFGIDTKAVLGKKLFVVDYHSSLLGSAEERSSYPKTEVRPVSDLEGIMFNVNSIASEHSPSGEGLPLYPFNAVPVQPVERRTEVLPDIELQGEELLRHDDILDP